MKLKPLERIALVILVTIGCFFCAAPAPVPVHLSGHTAAGCLAGCPSATYVELSPGGALCRCWAPNAFQYTFRYPSNAAEAEYPRGRWQEGIRAVQECRARGLAWEPDASRDHLQCVQPTSVPMDPRIWLQRASVPGQAYDPPRWLQAPARRRRLARA
jgi:hypothetical protein